MIQLLTVEENGVRLNKIYNQNDAIDIDLYFSDINSRFGVVCILCVID